MKLRDLRTYLNFLSKNKVYTFVSIFGFSVSLMFVILLAAYAQQEFTMDDFQEKADRIYLMTHDYEPNFGNPVAPYVKETTPEVEAYCRVMNERVAYRIGESELIQSEALFADSTFFEMFSFKLLEGNPSQVFEAQRSVVVSENFVNKFFDGKSPVGKTMEIGEWEHTITGVMENMPNNTQFIESDMVILYTTIALYRGDWILETSSNFGFTAYLLEKENANLPAKIPQLLEQFKKEFWYYKNGFSDQLELIPLKDVYLTAKGAYGFGFKTNSKTLINVYITVAILILIVAAFNYINMTVAQAGFRGKEAAIKKLLGADKRTIVTQLLGESLLMTTFAFGLGLLLAFVCEPYFSEVLPNGIDLTEQLTTVNILIAIGAILLISFVAGVIPATVISNFNPLEVVKGGFSKRVKATYSKVLVVFQYSVAIALLICAMFIKQQSDFLINRELGYDRENIYYMGIALSPEQKEGLKSKMLSVPGVENVTYSSGTPMDGGNNSSFEADGKQYSTQEILIDEEFFNVYNIATDPAHIDLKSDDAEIISKELYNSPLTNKEEMTVMIGDERYIVSGLIEDIHLRSLHDTKIQYVRISRLPDDHWPWNMSVKIGAGQDIFKVADKIVETYKEYMGGKIPEFHEFVDEHIEGWYSDQKNQTLIITAFTILTVIIAVMGIFAMSLYMIKQKQKEIGLRKINGATVGQILLLLNKDNFWRLLVAFVVATPVSYLVMQKWLEQFPYRIGLNWWTFVLAGVAIALLSFLTVSYMSWKAARTNPVETLKSE